MQTRDIELTPTCTRLEKGKLDYLSIKEPATLRKTTTRTSHGMSLGRRSLGHHSACRGARLTLLSSCLFPPVMIGHDRLGSVTSWVDHKQKVAAKSPRVPCCLVDAAFFRFPHTPTPSPLWHRTTRSSNSQLDRNREHVLAANFQAWLVPKISVFSAFSAFCFHVLFFVCL